MILEGMGEVSSSPLEKELMRQKGRWPFFEIGRKGENRAVTGESENRVCDAKSISSLRRKYRASGSGLESDRHGLKTYQ